MKLKMVKASNHIARLSVRRATDAGVAINRRADAEKPASATASALGRRRTAAKQ
jgi:hypothetical protein